MRHYAMYLTPLLLLLGCSTTTPSVAEYTLFTSQTLPSRSAPLSAKTLSVASSKTFSSLSGKNLVYLRDNGESAPYLYSRWSDSPSVLLQRSLLKALYEHSLFASASPSPSLAQYDWVLESDLDAFYHRFSGDGSDGYIDITYRLIDARTKRPLAAKRFIVSSPSPSMEAKGGVEALKNATHELNAQCIAWLSTLIKEMK